MQFSVTSQLLPQISRHQRNGRLKRFTSSRLSGPRSVSKRVTKNTYSKHLVQFTKQPIIWRTWEYNIRCIYDLDAINATRTQTSTESCCGRIRHCLHNVYNRSHTYWQTEPFSYIRLSMFGARGGHLNPHWTFVGDRENGLEDGCQVVSSTAMPTEHSAVSDTWFSFFASGACKD